MAFELAVGLLNDRGSVLKCEIVHPFPPHFV